MAWRRRDPHRDINWATSRAVATAREKDAKLSQREVWERLGVNKSWYTRLEQNETAWTVEKLDAVAQVLGTTASALMKAAEQLLQDETPGDEPWIAALGG